jgi:hypothetical protein
MNRLMAGGALAATLGAALAVASPLPASAQLARPQTALGIVGDNGFVTDVQFRGRGGFRGAGFRGGAVGWRGGAVGWRGGAVGWRGGPGWRGAAWRGYGWRPYRRPWIWPGVGFATGLAIGGAFAAPYYYDAPYYYNEPVNSDAVAYCIRRFKSYDVASGTYLGFDGRRHPCP